MDNVNKISELRKSQKDLSSKINELKKTKEVIEYLKISEQYNQF